jgi:hypothetical protein
MEGVLFQRYLFLDKCAALFPGFLLGHMCLDGVEGFIAYVVLQAAGIL